jgi:hypothetical protein
MRAISVSSRNTCGIENDMGMKDGARDDLATGAAGFETGWHGCEREYIYIWERVVARSKPTIGGIVGRTNSDSGTAAFFATETLFCIIRPSIGTS